MKSVKNGGKRKNLSIDPWLKGKFLIALYDFEYFMTDKK
jgi:hypothetical protein